MEISILFFLQIFIFTYAQNTPVPYGQLQVRGRFLTDKQGNTVQLRGLSFFPVGENYFFDTEQTLYLLKTGWNINVIRAPVLLDSSCCGGWIPPETRDLNYQNLVTYIENAIKHGLYILVDWHAFEDPLTDDAIEFFTNISKTYGSYPNIIYELWNEPSGSNGSWPIIKEYAETVIDVIRQYDPNNIVVVGTPTWSQRVDEAAKDPINRTNVAYTLHYYAKSHGAGNRNITQNAVNMNLPIFVTEYGMVEATGGYPLDVPSSYLWWELLDANNISYVNWAVLAKSLYGAADFINSTQQYQLADPAMFSDQGYYVNKKYKQTDQGVTGQSYNRLDCLLDPAAYADPNACAKRGCIQDPFYDFFDPLEYIPKCYFPQTTGYIAEESVDSNPVTIKKSSLGAKNPYGPDFEELVVQSYELGSALRITIVPKGVTRYRPPVPVNISPQISSPDKFNLIKNNGSIFSFIVQRNSTGTKIWDTSIGGLLFADKFIQIATYLPTDNVYGFGENLHTTLKHNISAYITWGMWARDNSPAAKKNLYGVHPFYIGIEDDGKAHGVFIFNSNAQEVTLGPAPHLTYRTIGGQLEIFYFPGPTPEEVIQQYQQVIGTTFMPSYWALGFHICRYGYNSTADVQVVVNRTIAANIPFDTAWADINYMDKVRDFTLDPINWGDFGNYTDYLHQQGMHVILITDAGIEVDYDPFQRAREQNASFIEWPRFDMVPHNIEDQYPLTNGTKIMLGVVFPANHVAFPDFLDPTNKTNEWWVGEFSIFRKTVAVDGIWIDMNEPSVFGTEVYNTTNEIFHVKAKGGPLKCPISGSDGEYDNPPYYTYSAYNNGPYLSTFTLCLCGVSARGTQKVYDTKNLFGWSEMVATSWVQKQSIGKRGAVISRSTFPTSGVFGGHWTGDVHSTWDDLKNSVIAIQEFNLFGIPFVGADICGFAGDTTENLCLRWQQLGAFYPFMRNHNNHNSIAQDPAAWPSVAEASRKANLFRYRHLPYLYSLLFSAALKGGTVVRPVFFEFPNDPATYNISLQFMWGSAMMIIPVTDEFVEQVEGYLPIAGKLPNERDILWYSLYDYFYGTAVNRGYSSFAAPIEYLIPVFVRGGYIIPRQRPSATTTLSRQNEFQLLIATNTTSFFVDSKATTYRVALGELYWDDGESIIDDINTYNYYHFLYSFSSHDKSATLNITMDRQATNLTLPTLDNIEILGYPYTPNLTTAKLNGQPIAINTALSGYSPFTQILNITTTNFINLNNNGPIWLLTWENTK